MLLFRPGKLTRDCITGKRSRYIAPVPLFLLVVFLMFFAFSFVHISPGGGATGENGKQLTQAEARKQQPKVDAELADIDRQIAAARAKGAQVGDMANFTLNEKAREALKNPQLALHKAEGKTYIQLSAGADVAALAVAAVCLSPRCADV